MSSARSGIAAQPECPDLQSCGLGWGDEGNLPFSRKVGNKILFTLFLSCPLLTAQLRVDRVDSSPPFIIFPWVEIPHLKGRMGSDLSFTAC